MKHLILALILMTTGQAFAQSTVAGPGSVGSNSVSNSIGSDSSNPNDMFLCMHARAKVQVSGKTKKADDTGCVMLGHRLTFSTVKAKQWGVFAMIGLNIEAANSQPWFTKADEIGFKTASIARGLIRSFEFLPDESVNEGGRLIYRVGKIENGKVSLVSTLSQIIKNDPDHHYQEIGGDSGVWLIKRSELQKALGYKVWEGVHLY